MGFARTAHMENRQRYLSLDILKGIGIIYLKIGRASCRERVCQYV